jgi:HK97 family phage major capsid protein
LLAQSTVDVENLVRDDLTAIHALAWDRAVIHGSGASNQPTGIYTLSGVNAVAMGGVPTFGKLVDMVTEVAIDNALLNSLGFVSTPGMAGKLMQTLVASSAGSAMIWSGRIDDGQLVGYRAIASNQVLANLGTGTDEHGIVFGNWSDVLIGTWGALELITDPYRLKKQGMIEVTSFEMVDIAARHAESFTKATGAKLS